MKIVKRDLNWTVLFVALTAFLILMMSVVLHEPFVAAVDGPVADFWRQTVNAKTTGNMVNIATLGSPEFAIIAAVVGSGLLIWRRQLNSALLLLANIGGGSVFLLLAKNFVQRARPVAPVVAEHGYSFPSGHVFCTIILVVWALRFVWPRVTDEETRVVMVLAGIIWTAVILCSRLYLRAHFATDVFGAVLLGVAWSEIMYLTQGTLVARINQGLKKRG